MIAETTKKKEIVLARLGEITLKGRVLAIGGLKEKMLGAKRAGIRKILVPLANKKDIDDIPEEIRAGMQVVYVNHLDDVLKHMFPARQEKPAPAAARRRAAPRSAAPQGSTAGKRTRKPAKAG